MSWLFLFFAISFEVAATTSMRASQGLTKMGYSLLMLAFYVLSFVFLNLSLKSIPLHIAYAIWSGVGILLIVTIGIIYFSDKLNLIQSAFMVLIISGVIGLILTMKHH